MALQFNNYQPKHYNSTNAQWEVIIHGDSQSGFSWHVTPLINGEYLTSGLFETFSDCVRDCECHVPHFQNFGN